MATIPSELFTLTYGSIVTQIIKDFEDPAKVNEQLEIMGYNIGLRIIDEFFAKSRAPRCKTFADAIRVLATDGFKMFLGVSGTIEDWHKEGTACTIKFTSPLTDFVELPPSMAELRYSNIVCGVVRGALEMIHMRVECEQIADVLKGAPCDAIRVELKEILEDAAGEEYKEG